jgi:hypothetical protein
MNRRPNFTAHEPNVAAPVSLQWTFNAIGNRPGSED